MSERKTEQAENRAAAQERQPGLEERFASIEGILDEMENPDVSIEQSFALYKQGLEELDAANRMLDEMEKAMLVMTEDGGLEEF